MATAAPGFLVLDACVLIDVTAARGPSFAVAVLPAH